MEPYFPTKTELRERFGLSARLAARIQALARLGVHGTEALLETLGSDERARTMILDERVLAAARAQNGPGMSALLAGASGDEAPVLACDAHEGRAVGVIGLAEEALVEGAPRIALGASGQREPRAEIVATAGRHLQPISMVGDFVDARAVIERLRWDMLTHASLETRTTALRRLTHLPCDAPAKIAVLTEVFVAQEDAMRGEVLAALKTLTANDPIVEALALRFGADPRSSSESCRALAAALSEADAAALATAAPLLCASYGELDEGARLALLRCPVEALVQDHAPTEAWISAVIGHFDHESHVEYEALIAWGLRFVERYGLAALEELRERARRRGPGPERAALDLAREAAPSGFDAESARRFTRLSIEAITESQERPPGWRRWASAMPALAEGTSSLMGEFVGRLDALFALAPDHSDPLQSRALSPITQAGLSLWPRLRSAERLAFLESALPACADDDTCAAMARTLARGLDEWTLDEQRRVAERALLRLGRPAWAALLEEGAGGAGTARQARCLSVLTELIEAGTPALERAELERAFLLLRGAFEREDFAAHGPAARALGALAAREELPVTCAVEILELLQDWVLRTSATYDVLTAVTAALHHPALDAPRRDQAIAPLLDILDMNLARVSARRPKIVDGAPMYELGRETSFYTELVPRLLEGLRALAQAPRLELSRDRIAAWTLTRWRGALEGDASWAPMNVAALARVMLALALHPSCGEELGRSLINAVRGAADRLAIAELLAQACVDAPPREDWAALAASLIDDLGKRLSREALEVGERHRLLAVLLGLLAWTDDTDQIEDPAVIDAVVTAACRAYGEGAFSLEPHLRALVGQADLERRVREQILATLDPPTPWRKTLG